MADPPIHQKGLITMDGVKKPRSPTSSGSTRRTAAVRLRRRHGAAAARPFATISRPPMADQTTKLDVHAREAAHSRETRRLRRAGQVPGVLYGGGEDPVSFAVDERDAAPRAGRARARCSSSASTAASARPPCSRTPSATRCAASSMHVDLLRVDLNVADPGAPSPSSSSATRRPPASSRAASSSTSRASSTIEALPNEIPESIQVDVSKMEMNATLQLSEIDAPEGITLLDDPDATVLASITPPSVSTESRRRGRDRDRASSARAPARPRAAEDAGRRRRRRRSAPSGEPA